MIPQYESLMRFWVTVFAVPVQLKLMPVPPPVLRIRLYCTVLLSPLIVIAPPGKETMFDFTVLKLPSAQMPQFTTVLPETTVLDGKATPTPADIPGVGWVITRLLEIEPIAPCTSIPP